MGIQAKVEFIDLKQRRVFKNRAEALDSCLWMLDKVSQAEEQGLNRYVEERLETMPDGTMVLSRQSPIRWAVISWNK